LLGDLRVTIQHFSQMMNLMLAQQYHTSEQLNVAFSICLTTGFNTFKYACDFRAAKCRETGIMMSTAGK
jgi:hypothetical protein